MKWRLSWVEVEIELGVELELGNFNRTTLTATSDMTISRFLLVSYLFYLAALLPLIMIKQNIKFKGR